MVYFDNSATTPVCPEAVEAVSSVLTENFGNPGAVHSKGVQAATAVGRARAEIASALGCSPDEVYFSHSGTLANNTAVFGGVRARKKQANRIITSTVEHPSVARCMDELEAQGFNVVRLSPGKDGKINPADLKEALKIKTALVSIMMVNNETGAINDIKKLAAITKKENPDTIFHTDAIQGFGKLPFKASALGADLITMSGHKLHAPKGVGALYIRKGLKLPSFVVGGGQENGMFSGTEAVPAIAGFGASVKALGNAGVRLEKVEKIRNYLAAEIIKIEDCTINSPADALPYILNISVKGIPSQVLINYLSGREIYVSAGSACKKGHRSEVLTALGIEPALIDSAIRISLSCFSTTDEAEEFISALKDARKTIRTKL